MMTSCIPAKVGWWWVQRCSSNISRWDVAYWDGHRWWIDGVVIGVDGIDHDHPIAEPTHKRARATGWYWVRENQEWFLRYWDTQRWRAPGVTLMWEDRHYHEIDERPITRQP